MSIGQILVDKFGHDGWHVDKDLKLAIYDNQTLELLHICNVSIHIFIYLFSIISLLLTRNSAMEENCAMEGIKSCVFVQFLQMHTFRMI